MFKRYTLVKAFANENRFWKYLAALVLFLAVCKGLREANTWALTQMSLDYRLGFMKRGLHGQVMHACGIFRASQLRHVAQAELVLFFGLLYFYVRRSPASTVSGQMQITCVFFGSYAVTYLANLIGYVDLLNAGLLLCLLIIENPLWRFMLGLPLVPCMLLLHENSLLLFLPVYLFTFVCDALRCRSGGRSKRFGVTILILSATVMLIEARCAGAHTSALQEYQYLSPKVDFPLRLDLLESLDKDTRYNLRMMERKITHSPRWWWTLIESFFTLGPSSFVLIHFLKRHHSEMKKTLSGPQGRALSISIALVIGCPLLLNLVGWDQFRWNVFAELDGFLILIMLMREVPERLTIYQWERNLIVLALLLSMASGYALFDGNTVNPYPFYPRLVPGSD